MAIAQIRRQLRRALARSRFAYYRYLTRRSTRIMRRAFFLIILVVIGLALYDYRQPERQRFVKGEVIRQSLKRRPASTRKDPRKWPTWSGIDTIFAFGDSQSSSGFNPRGPQPDLENPLGNPAWPGMTSSYGANFLGHMTASFNETFIRTYNLATKAAPILAQTEKLSGLTLDDQIEKKFLKLYGPSEKRNSRDSKGIGKWSRKESLFVIYFGVDDLLYTTVERLGGRNSTTIENNIAAYQAGMEKIYAAGGRNFLLVNFPQMEEAPFMRNSGIMNYIWDFGAEIVQYNGRLAFMAHRFGEKHLDANIFVFNNHKLSLTTRQEPTQFPETSSYVRMTGFCFPYVHNIWWTDTHRVFDKLCDVPLDGWYWRDDMHMTEPYHRLMARQIIELLKDPWQRLPMEFY